MREPMFEGYLLMGREVIVITADRTGWTLVHQGKRIGPYPKEMDALSIAQLWAEGARRQGIMLEFVVQDSESSAQQVLDTRVQGGRSTDENSRV